MAAAPDPEDSHEHKSVAPERALMRKDSVYSETGPALRKLKEEYICGYITFSDDVAKSICPISLGEFDPSSDKGKYVTIRSCQRELTADRIADAIGCGYVVGGYVYNINPYEIDAAYEWFVTRSGIDPKSRAKLSQNALDRIRFRYEIRDVMGIEFDPTHFFKNWIKTMAHIHISMDQIQMYNAHMTPEHFGCFHEVDRTGSIAMLDRVDSGWMVRPSSIKGVDFYIASSGELKPCSKFYSLSFKMGEIRHILIEHAFGEGYYSAGGCVDRENPTRFVITRYTFNVTLSGLLSKMMESSDLLLKYIPLPGYNIESILGIDLDSVSCV
jgi:hypothetical protein